MQSQYMKDEDDVSLTHYLTIYLYVIHLKLWADCPWKECRAVIDMLKSISRYCFFAGISYTFGFQYFNQMVECVAYHQLHSELGENYSAKVKLKPLTKTYWIFVQQRDRKIDR